MSERVPLPLPLGWYCVADEAELAAGELRRVRYFGQELVLWRGEDGEPHLFDAYCPHLGAHLGVGGKVEGSALRCPFHAWKFEGSGPLHRHPLREADSAQGGAPQLADPATERPRLRLVRPERRRSALRRARAARVGLAGLDTPELRSFEVKAHPQEMAENIVDAVHFRFVHGSPTSRHAGRGAGPPLPRPPGPHLQHAAGRSEGPRGREHARGPASA